MVIRQPVGTFFNEWDLTQATLLRPARIKARYSIEVMNEFPEEALKELNVVMWPRDFKMPPYEFRYVDMAKDARNPGRADFEMPIDDRKDAPPYILAVYANDNKVDLKNFHFRITWK